MTIITFTKTFPIILAKYFLELNYLTVLWFNIDRCVKDLTHKMND